MCGGQLLSGNTGSSASSFAPVTQNPDATVTLGQDLWVGWCLMPNNRAEVDWQLFIAKQG